MLLKLMLRPVSDLCSAASDFCGFHHDVVDLDVFDEEPSDVV
jgi:hypothetical protein